MYTAKDVLNSNVITVASDATVEEAARLLLENCISGAPITEEDGTLLGIVSEFPLLEIIYSPELKTAPVKKFMTRDVLAVEEDTILSDIASIFVTHRIRRVPVLRHGKVVGVVSRADLLRYALTKEEELVGFVASARAVGRQVPDWSAATIRIEEQVDAVGSDIIRRAQARPLRGSVGS